MAPNPLYVGTSWFALPCPCPPPKWGRRRLAPSWCTTPWIFWLGCCPHAWCRAAAYCRQLFAQATFDLFPPLAAREEPKEETEAPRHAARPATNLSTTSLSGAQPSTPFPLAGAIRIHSGGQTCLVSGEYFQALCPPMHLLWWGWTWGPTLPGSHTHPHARRGKQ